MTLPVFTETKTCVGGKLCFRCRDPGAEGEAWRTAMARTHQVPDGWVCPPERGAKPMRLPEPKRGLGTLIEKGIKAATLGTLKTCGKCAKRRDALDRMFPG